MSLTPTYAPSVASPLTVSNVTWGYPDDYSEQVWYIQGDNIHRARYLVHQGAPNSISVIGLKNSWDATSPDDHTSEFATWQRKYWDATISGGSWQDIGDPVELQINGDCLTQDTSAQSLYVPISGKYGDPEDSFYPYCAGKLTIPEDSTPDEKYEGTFDMTEDLILTSTKNSNVKLKKIVSYTGIDYLFFDGNVSCVSGSETGWSTNIVDQTGTIKTIARLRNQGFDTLPTIAQVKATLKSADGSDLVDFPANYSDYESRKILKNCLGVMYRNLVGPGHNQRMLFGTSYVSYLEQQGFYDIYEDSEITSNSVSDWRAIPLNRFFHTQESASYLKSEIRIEGEELLPVIQGIGGPPVSGAAMTVEDTTYTIANSGGIISYPAAATQQAGFTSVRKNSFGEVIQDNFALEVEVVEEATLDTDPLWGTDSHAYAVKVKPITNIGDLALPVVGIRTPTLATSWSFALNQRTGVVHRIWQANPVATEDFHPYSNYSSFPFSTCLHMDQNVGLPEMEWKNQDDHTEGIKVSHCQFLIYTNESSIAISPLQRTTKPVMRDFGWKTGDKLTLMTQGKTYRDANRVLPVCCAPTTLLYTGSSNSTSYYEDLPVDRVYFQFFYSDDSSGSITIQKLDDAQGTGEYEGNTTSLYSVSLPASDYAAQTWNYKDLPTPISGKQTIEVLTTGGSNLQGVYLFSRKTGYYQLVRSDDGETVFGGRVHIANTHI